MKNIGSKFTVFFLVLLFGQIAYAYDGRGGDSCSSLRDDVIDAKERYEDAMRSAREAQRQSEMEMRAYSSMGYGATNEYEAIGMLNDYMDSEMNEYANEARAEFESAQMEYSMNGCTTGGSTRYNHNYNH